MNYKVLRTAPTVYLNQAGDAVNGFRVTVYLPDFDETHILNVPDLGMETVKAGAEKLVADRQALADLGVSEEG